MSSERLIAAVPSPGVHPSATYSASGRSWDAARILTPSRYLPRRYAAARRPNSAKSGALPTAHSRSTSSTSSTPASTPSHRLPRRIAIALHLKADLRIGIGAEHPPVPLSLDDRELRVDLSRGGVM